MDNLAFLALGFVLGVISTLKIVLTVQECRRRAADEKPAEQSELRVATVEGQVLEDFT